MAVADDIQNIYDGILENVSEDTVLTADYMDRINKHFYAYLKNPTDTQEDTFKRLRDALIVLWLSELFKKIEKQIKAQLKNGLKTAKSAIKQAQIKSIIKKTITSETIQNIIKSNLEQAKTEITYVSNAIKVNSDRAISDIKSNIDKTKKTIRTELMAEFAKYGIAYYTDTLGRRQSIRNYVNMKSSDMVINAFRDSYITELVRNGVEYGIVRRLPTEAIECQNCLNYDNVILAFSENDLGYETVAEARSYNLFHFFCFHYLEPIPAPTEKATPIKHSEENLKSKERNDRKNKKFGLLS